MTAEGILRERGLRVTPQRRAVLQYFLFNEGDHQTADGLWNHIQQAFPEIARGTVYKALHDLIDARLLEHIPAESGGDLYGLRLAPHHHFICDRCGHLYDLSPSYQPLLEAPNGDPIAVVREIDVLLRGVCRSCAEVH
ncbi:MAG: transcriptional repressor [Firmicutes bacterium]|jgi:Fe2+ or Zn2+ uptake regulation protein|nr:transcriptional repressor [Bacillota bacterium]